MLSGVVQSATDVQAPAKAAGAAHDFEALLLGSLLRSLQRGFSLLAEDESAAAGSYKDLATEALARAMAARGGLGIADLILRNLVKGRSLSEPEGAKVEPSSGR